MYGKYSDSSSQSDAGKVKILDKSLVESVQAYLFFPTRSFFIELLHQSFISTISHLPLKIYFITTSSSVFPQVP